MPGTYAFSRARYRAAAVLAGALAVAAAGAFLGAAPSSATTSRALSLRRAATAGTGFSVDHADTYKVAQENGPGSINHTASRWDVYGADLGSMFTYRGRTYMVFGDTFGSPSADPFFSVPHSDWRSNTMAYIGSQARPEHGLYFSGMITGPSGAAEELLSSKKVPGVEQTVIPTYGVAVGNTMYLYFMSVKQFGAPGHWTLNYSGVAYSTDGGQTWRKDPGVTWPGDSNFGQAALVKHGGYVYEFGIPGGRYGAAQLARVPRRAILDKAAYQYWAGGRWVTDNPAAATDVVPAPVGELSVQWNSYYHRWLMMYLDDPAGQIVLRTAKRLTGPWSSAQVVVTAQQYPSLYAPYITPRWDNGPDIYFTMSVFGPYQVYLMHTSLTMSGRP